MPGFDNTLRMKWLQLRQLADTVLKRDLDGSQLLDEIHAITMPHATRNDFLNSTIELVMELLRTKTQLYSAREQSPQGDLKTEVILKDVGMRILAALDGKCMTLQQLANEVSGGETSTLYRGGLKTILIASGKVAHKKSIGYYRTDSPPLDRILSIVKVRAK
ncbi:MAG: hypothetical protein DWH81_05965 [Planctomycetota bacterium]|nr:MAG: hypothetical protein DWH81_05965 [Planctomycetota bacterium]